MACKNVFLFASAFLLFAVRVLGTAPYRNPAACSPLIKDKIEQQGLHPEVKFMENKGQMGDMKGNPAPYVLFKAQMPGMDLYLTENGFTYVFITFEEEEKQEYDRWKRKVNLGTEQEEIKIQWERIDVDFPGAVIRRDNIVKDGMRQGDFNFFYPYCPDGIYGIREYERITVKEIYAGIDLVLYNSNEKGFKYDFIVGPGADPGQIRMVYSSRSSLNLEEDGSIRIHTRDRGALVEKAPVSYQGDQAVRTEFIKTLSRENDKGGYDSQVRFQIGEYDLSRPLVIDPIVVPNLVWGTYYGGAEIAGFSGMDIDKNGNIFLTAYIYGSSFPLQNMAGGYYQGTMAGTTEGGILKFSPAGQRLWSTFYGGSTGSGLGQDKPSSIAVDNAGNIFITGNTECTNFPVFNPGGGVYFQGTHGGGTADIFILKFNNSGVRQWATFYGGNGWETGASVSTDLSGNVFVTGMSPAANFPTLNPGGGAFFQGACGGNDDAVILKFDNNGVRQWATYYGGTDDDHGVSIVNDNAGNILVTGITLSANFPLQNLPGAYNQATYAGGTASYPSMGGDVFILKFNNTAVRQWATFYGGAKGEEGHSITADNNGNIFVVGVTESTDFPVFNPAGGAYFQGTYAGGKTDLFILKFSNTSVRDWATFYGGSGDDAFARGDIDREKEVTTDPGNGDVFVTATTTSANFPTLNSGGFFKAASQGGQDAVILQFSNTGAQKWATYQGGGSRDFGVAIKVSPNGCLYVAGEWQGGGSNGLLNPGSPAYYDASFGSMGDDGCIMQFCSNCTAPTGTISATPSACTANNGTATVVGTGGTQPYTYLWSPGGQTTSTATGLGAGTYTVVVSEAAGCTKSFTVAVTQQGAVTASVTSTPASCGNNNGSGNVTVSGGTAPFTFAWSPSGGSGPAASGLAAGTYTISITDANGCTATQTLAITQSPGLTTSVTAVPASCGNPNGSATAVPGGGSSPYTFSWSPTGGNGPTATGLGAGSYTVIITDAGGCSATQTVSIVQSAALTASTSATPASCGNNNGTGSVIPAGGTSPFTYSWSPIGGTSPVATGLGAGNYTVSISDAGGCFATQTLVITSSPGITTSVSSTPTTCGNNVGSATVTPSGGTSPYTYSWSPSGGTGPTATGLGSGMYVVVVTDAGGCTQTSTVIISNSNGPAVTLSSQSNIVCYGGNNGSATVGVTGGTAPYTFTWSPSGGNGPTATGLSAGIYTVTVRDGNGCSQIQIVTITQPGSLAAGVASSPVCGVNNGSATVTPSGGTGPYAYNWLPSGGNGATASSLSSGTYTCTITDANGCSHTISVNVVANASPTAAVSANVTITQGHNTTLGATGGGTYMWSNGMGGSSIVVNPLFSTDYCVTITDPATSCSDTACLRVTVEPIDCSGAGVVFLPNAFSPNDDGENDVLKIYYGNHACLRQYKLIVYNRWGEKVFESEDPSQGWDGTFRGNPETSAVFVYYLRVELITGEKISRKGNISLM